MKKTTLVLALILALATVFAGRSRRPKDPVEDGIEKIERQMKAAMNTGDSSLFVDCYTPDACILPPNAPTLCGRQGLQRFFHNLYYQAGIRDAIFTHLGLYGQTAEYVTQHGSFEVFNAAQQSVNKGKVLIIWKKTDAGWKIYRHMLNFDAPMAPVGTR